MSAGSPGGDTSGDPAPDTPAQPVQPAQTSRPGPDLPAARQPAGNGFSPAGQHVPQQAGQFGYPQGGQYGYPQPGPSGYPSSAYYSPPVPVARTNRPAIAALVCGLVQFPLGLVLLNILLAIPAIICGAIGIRQTRERGEAGRGMAIAGLVLGILGIAYFAIALVLIIVVAHIKS